MANINNTGGNNQNRGTAFCLSKLTSSHIWLVSTIFFLGITYSKVLDNTKRLDERTVWILSLDKVRLDQKVLSERFNSEKRYQESLLKAIEALGGSLNGIKEEVSKNSKETMKNNYKLENIENSIEELKSEKS